MIEIRKSTVADCDTIRSIAEVAFPATYARILTQYQIDYGAQRYRMVVRIGEHMLSAEFTFEEVFSEQMETLEEMRKEREE